MILVDEAIWPAHGTVWAHLVSDTSLEELHEFARANGLPPKGFDLDHYDVPQARIAELVAAGAVQVSSRELLARLVASGLRVRGMHREAEGLRRRDADLWHRWGGLAAHVLPRTSPEVGRAWRHLGSDLLTRWAQPHRHYHDTAHLYDVLLSLDTLLQVGERVDAPVLVAAWFHDAVYEGRPQQDEEDSARLAETALLQVGARDEVIGEAARLVRVTIDHDVAGGAGEAADHAGAVLVDADLSILAAPAKRYDAYTQAVRREYAHVPDEAFRQGRGDVLARFLSRDRLFHTRAGRQRWEDAARANINAELRRLRGLE